MIKKNKITKKNITVWILLVAAGISAAIASYVYRLRSQPLGMSHAPNIRSMTRYGGFYELRNSRVLNLEVAPQIDNQKRIKMLDVLKENGGIDQETYDKTKENYQE